MTSLIQRARALPSGVFVALTLFFLTAFLWLPFGLNVGYVADGWVYFHHTDRGGAMSEASPTRLLLPLPWMIAYLFDPGHFAGTNIAVLLLIFGKGCLVYLILRRLNAPLTLAFAAAVLAILLPVDSGVFYLGALAIHFAVLCMLLAFYLLIVYWEKPHVSLLLGLMITLYGSIAIYELVYPLIAVAPLVLIYLRRRITRRVIGVSLLWYLIPLLNALWYLAIVTRFPSAMAYQGTLIERPTISTMVISLFEVYLRHFLTGWFPYGAVLTGLSVVISAIAGDIVCALCLWLRRRESAPVATRLPLLLALSGLGIIALGVALYLPTNLHDVTMRTYYYAMIGGALTLAALLWQVARRPLIFAALIGVMASLGTLSLLNQHQAYNAESEYQQTLLAELGQVLTQPKPGTGILLVDETPDRSFRHAIRSDFYFEYSIPVLYHDYSLQAETCSPDDFGTEVQNRCRVQNGKLIVPSIRSGYFGHTFDNLIVMAFDGKTFRIVRDLTPFTGSAISAYQPDKLYTPGGSPPTRIIDLFGFPSLYVH